MDLFLRDAPGRIDPDNVLSKIDALVDWPAFSPILKRGLKRSGVGPQGYDPQVLFKCLMIGKWHGLSVPKLERALKVRLDFMVFCGLSSVQAIVISIQLCNRTESQPAEFTQLISNQPLSFVRRRFP